MNTATQIDPTSEILKEMLGENTGTHMLDSGGSSGRHWQRNQGRDFDAEPEAKLETWVPSGKGYDTNASISITVNVYHFLRERLEYDPERTEALHEFSKTPDFKDESWLVCMKGWMEKLAEDKEKEVGGIYGEGEPFTVNTYNHDSLISQVIQYTYWTEKEWDERAKRFENVAYVALQIHGGADVRGGYTAPRVFRTSDADIFDDDHADIVCDECDARWYTDDAYHWYCDTSETDLMGSIVAAKEGDEGPRVGVTYVTKNAAYCPCCGKGKLHAHPPCASC